MKENDEAYTMDECIDEDLKTALQNTTRVEVIDETGRAYVRWECKIDARSQDDGRTLKIFVSDV